MKTDLKMNANSIIAATRKAAFRNITNGVKRGVEVSKHLCPVDEGDLTSTITDEDDGAGHASFGVGGPSNVSDKNVNYHVYVEWGTRKMAAQSFFRPGVDAANTAIRNGMKVSS